MASKIEENSRTEVEVAAVVEFAVLVAATGSPGTIGYWGRRMGIVVGRHHVRCQNYNRSAHLGILFQRPPTPHSAVN